MGKKVGDIIGRRFGSLLVVEQVESDASGSTRWKCLCDCGNEYTVIGYRLRNGDVEKCLKCSKEEKLIDITGNRFGMWTVIRRSDPNSNRKWRCNVIVV